MPKRASGVPFTKAYLDALPLPEEGKRSTYHDATVPGLQVRVSSTGTKTFSMQVRAPGERVPVRVRLGEYPHLSIQAARQAALHHLSEIKGGGWSRKGPAAQPEVDTLAEVFRWWLERHAEPRKLKYTAACRKSWALYFGPLAGARPEDLRPAVVIEWHARVGEKAGPTAANRALSLLSVLINKAIAAERWPLFLNPVKAVERFPERSRERRLGQGEVGAFLAAARAYPHPDLYHFVLLALFTGARKGAILALRWEDLDLEQGLLTLRAEQAKTKRSQQVPLVPLVVEELKARKASSEGSWVFPATQPSKSPHRTSIRKPWDALLAELGMKDLRAHDLRRTLASFMGDAGATSKTVGTVLGHLDPKSTAVYERLAIKPQRLALEAALGEMLGGA